MLKLRKNDILLAAGILAAAVLLLIIMAGGRAREAGYVEVRIDGETAARYPLSEDREIQAGEHNRFEIRGGKVKMTQADCPDGLCLNMPEISRAGETIICLPNKVTLCITGGEEAEHDAVAG